MVEHLPSMAQTLDADPITRRRKAGIAGHAHNLSTPEARLADLWEFKTSLDYRARQGNRERTVS